jgi:alpha-tubulin suppressor-like RCC1 family protein
VRWWVVLVVVGACRFEHGALSGDAPPGGTDAADAPADATIDAVATACAVDVVAAGAHTCVRKIDGTVWCWGKNGQGETSKDPSNSATCTIQSNDFVCVKNPKQVPLPAAATAMGAGDQHTCVIANGKTYCFGANDSGQFGNGNTGDSYNPVEIATRAGATQIAGSEGSTCSLQNGNTACSGLNNHGEVGNGTTSTFYTPYSAQGAATKLAMGFRNTCTIVSGAVTCWGDNSNGQVDTTLMPRMTPTNVPNAPLSTDLSVGYGHVCARQATGSLTCWGRNVEGQLGVGSTSPSEAPALVAASNVAQVAAGGYHTCVRLTDGSVQCWGESYGTSPVAIALPGAAVVLASGSYHSCAVLADGTLWCWGWNAYGQFGNGTSSGTINNTPVKSDVCP